MAAPQGRQLDNNMDTVRLGRLDDMDDWTGRLDWTTNGRLDWTTYGRHGRHGQLDTRDRMDDIWTTGRHGQLDNDWTTTWTTTGRLDDLDPHTLTN